MYSIVNKVEGNMVDIRLLRLFIAIYEEKNLTLAAEKCHITQPSISAALKQLEELLGNDLFLRDKKGVQPLNSAHELYPHAKRLVNDSATISTLFMSKATTPKISVGVCNSISKYKTATTLSHLERLAPNCYFILTSSDKSDCRIGFEKDKNDTDLFIPLWEEKFVFVTKENIPAPSKIEDFYHLDFIECPSCEVHQEVLGLISSKNIALNIVSTAETKEQAFLLALAGLGSCFLPMGLVEKVSDINVFDINLPIRGRIVGLCMPSHQAINPVLKKIRSDAKLISIENF
ncbi:LysR family transcriptional regulator [Aeromonas veronii]